MLKSDKISLNFSYNKSKKTMELVACSPINHESLPSYLQNFFGLALKRTDYKNLICFGPEKGRLQKPYMFWPWKGPITKPDHRRCSKWRPFCSRSTCARRRKFVVALRTISSSTDSNARNIRWWHSSWSRTVVLYTMPLMWPHRK